MTIDNTAETLIASLPAARRAEPKINRDLFQVDPQDIIGGWEFDTPAESLLVATGINSTSDYILRPDGLIAVKNAQHIAKETVGRSLYHWQQAEGKGKLIGWGELAAALKICDKLNLAVVWRGEGQQLVVFNEDGVSYTHAYAGQEIPTEKRAELKGSFLIIDKSQVKDGKYTHITGVYDEAKLARLRAVSQLEPKAEVKEIEYQLLTIAGRGKEPIIQALTAKMGDPSLPEPTETILEIDPISYARAWYDNHPNDKVIIPPQFSKQKPAYRYRSGYKNAGRELIPFLEAAAKLTQPTTDQLALCAALTAACCEAVVYRRVNQDHARFIGRLQAMGEMVEAFGLIPREINVKRNCIKVRLQPRGEKATAGMNEYITDSLVVVTPASGSGRDWEWGRTAEQRDLHTDVLLLANLIPGFHLELPANPETSDLRPD